MTRGIDPPFIDFSMQTKYVLASCLLFVLMRGLGAEDAMKFIATGFMKVLDECKKELNLSDHLITELYHYWKLDYAQLQRDMGCAIICMSKKLELMDGSGKLHHGNAKEFAQKHGAAEDLASRMITVIHDCEKNNEGIEDDCSRVLEVAKCFRSGIHGLQYDPKVDVIITEVLTEI